MDPGEPNTTSHQPEEHGNTAAEQKPGVSGADPKESNTNVQHMNGQTDHEGKRSYATAAKTSSSKPNHASNCKPSQSGTENAQAKIQQASFYLHIPFMHVNKAEIVFEHLQKPVQLKLMEKIENGDVWYYKPFNNDIGREVRYRYRISNKKQSKSGDSSQTAVNEENYWIKESQKRSLTFQVQYDTFHSPNDSKFSVETRPGSCVFYSKKLLQKASNMERSITGILKQIEAGLLFLSSPSLAKETATWFFNNVDPSFDEYRLLYIAVMLGFLVAKYPECLVLDSNVETENKVDCLMQSLSQFRLVKLLTPYSVGVLENIGPILVNASSKPGWLTLAVYFSPWVGVKYVMKRSQKFSKQKCDDNEYLKLVNSLLEFLAGYPDKEPRRLVDQLLSKVVQTAPNEETVIGLSNSATFEKYCEASKTTKEKFFEVICNTWHENSETSEKLVDLTKIPANIRRRNTEICKIIQKVILKYLKEKREPTKEEVNALFTLILNQSEQEVIVILKTMVGSDLSFINGLLPMILNNKHFIDTWKNIFPQNRANICFEWIINKLRARSAMKDRKNAATGAYGYINDIMSCALNSEDYEVLDRLCELVTLGFLQFIEVPYLIRAHTIVAKYPEKIQNEYINVVEDCLKKNPEHARETFDEFVGALRESSSSTNPLSGLILSKFSKDLLLCILDATPISGTIKSPQEDHLKQMLDWCDVWRILLSATGDIKELQNKKTFKNGKTNWKSFSLLVKDSNISMKILSEITKQQHEDLSFIFATVNLGRSAPAKELEAKQKWYEKHISKLLDLERNSHNQLDLLESLMRFAKNVYEGSQWEPDPLVELNEQKKRTQTASAHKNEGFWGKFLPLLDAAKELQPFIKSESFMHVAKTCVKEYSSHNEDNDEDEFLPQPDMKWLATFLATEVKKRFHNKWETVLCAPSSITTRELDILLGDLKDKKKLEEEFGLLKDLFASLFTSEIGQFLTAYVKFPNLLNQVKQTITLLEVFGVTSDLNFIILTQFVNDYGKDGDVNVKAQHKSMLVVERMISGIMVNDYQAVIEELGSSNELISFIKEIVDEDIGFLTDAVEEHSDQFVSVSSVSELFEVHRFVGILTMCAQKKPDVLTFLETLKRSCKDENNMAAKLRQCSTNVNSLRGLYSSVANRGEITKEIITSCLKRGSYMIAKKDGVFGVTMTYKRDGEEQDPSYQLPGLQDLRSRAHLIVTSAHEKDKEPSTSDDDDDVEFSDFIVQVNLCSDIATLLSKLQFSGFRKYRKYWKRAEGTQALQDIRDTLQKDLETWERILSNARVDYYFLNYYRPQQLCILHDFLIKDAQSDTEEALSLIKFVDPNITKEQLIKYQKMYPLNESGDKPDQMVSDIGNALKNIFAEVNPVGRPITKRQLRMRASSRSRNSTVKPGELFVASLEEGSLLTANVMLILYEDTSNAFPEPYQVVFSGPQTTWEEVQLVLQRCFSQSQHLKRDSLFCIANVEQLSNEIQFELINAIKEKQHNVGEDLLKDQEDYRLALICRGGDHHHIVEEFAQYSHHISGMTDNALRKRLRSGWPEVKMVTSTFPGLGKTESIRKDVQKKKMNIVTFPISGPLHESKLIKRLKELKLKEYHCLHLDIGEVDNLSRLDTFLFRLIVTGMVSSGTQFYHLETTNLYIEIANTLNDRLRESLVILKYFNREHLKWRNKDLLVSSEITSNLQVVCLYLHAYDRETLESKDISFTGPQKVKPLSPKQCQELLDKYYCCETTDITFTVLNTFLAVLADQLLKFSESDFFKMDNLKSMVGDKAHGVRRNLFAALLKVSKDFASRSVNIRQAKDLQSLSQQEAAEELDKSSSSTSAQDMVERVEEMIRWENSNHLLVVFHGFNSQSIAPVYRDKDLVDANIANFLKSQAAGNKELENFQTMNQDQLQAKLEKIVCTKSPKKTMSTLFTGYVLTPDNMLKMILIILRVRGNVPVIIMGETGCGKTSLVKYLAAVNQSKFSPFGFHAGITEDRIKEFIQVKNDEARQSSDQIWVFLDEINTCDHLGLINELMCHRTFFGRPLHKNLVFLAACNPYKLRPKDQIVTAGLEGKNVKDEYSDLVYRVHPLPEAMIDYVWDYGSLAPSDEEVYIERMVENMPSKFKGVFVDLLVRSQAFIRQVENNHFCVSLRDVYRCICLAQWFVKMVETHKEVLQQEKSQKKTEDHLEKYRDVSEKYETKPIVKSIVLALAHCYQSRLPTDDLRREYREKIMKIFSRTATPMGKKGDVDAFEAIVRMEEEAYLGRMELPPGTAKNAALRENVFVMLVSILNRIPMFVVGKPGCSKSLSVQLIRTNLRGRDSKDALFRELPQLYVISYQGSESSTSEGITKIFEKASEYKKHNNDKEILPVVLLDEVGLAENSKNNPLKVLHSLLEPEGGQVPEVAVIGISNWALDAAKMNRAVHLSRPEPTIEDLSETGHSLLQDNDTTKKNNDKIVRCLAEAYKEYQENQTHKNFHGLRDYYSLIKSLGNSADLKQINIALQRNFGGIPDEVAKIQKIFLSKLEKGGIQDTIQDTIIPVTKLVQENLEDPLARHLMLVTSGDSATGLLKQSLNQIELSKEIITIFGSGMEEDMSEDYNYRILSRIILCMERDCILILRDLERIYGSLYDMLNQNYAVVGKRKNCRVALGAYSNPMCHVNDGFRCIVLIDHDKIDMSDPPFLNRFEKQLLRFSDVLTKEQQEMIKELRSWVGKMSTVKGYATQFKKSEMFAGFHEDTLPSLVLLHNTDDDDTKEDVIERCKKDLMWVATPDAVLRTQKCDRFADDPEEVNRLCEVYFEKPIHAGLESFIDTITQETTLNDEVGSKTIIMTYATIRTDISKCFSGNVSCQTERLSAYKSEKQLAEKVNHFWSVSQHDLLVLQCKPELDAEHMVLARSIIEEKRDSYGKTCQGNDSVKPKHVCIIVHLQRGKENAVPWQFSFLCGWKQVFLDVLVAPSVPLNEIRTESIRTLLGSHIWPLRKIIENDLLWCFTCIKYTQQQRSPESILRIAKNLFNSQEVYNVFERLILQWLENAFEENDPWQVSLACDKQALINSSTFTSAMKQHMYRLVREPLARIIYFLEKTNTWPPHVIHVAKNDISEKDDISEDEISEDDISKKGISEYEDMWCELIRRKEFLNMAIIPRPQGVGTYSLDGATLNLRLPFSQVIFTKIEAVRDLVLEKHVQVNENESNFDESGQLNPDIERTELEHYSEIIVNLVPEIREFSASCYHDYVDDLFDVVSKDFRETMSRKQRVSLVRSGFLAYVKQSTQPKDILQFYAKLHLFVWVSREQIIAQLQLVDYCQKFLRPDVLENLTNQTSSTQDVLQVPTRSEENDDTTHNYLDGGSDMPLGDFEDERDFGEIQSEDEEDGGTGGDFHDFSESKQYDTNDVNNNETEVANEEEDESEDENGSEENAEESEEEYESEEEEHDEEQENFEDVLVRIICNEMLPSQETVKTLHGDLESWIRNASLMLSLAYKVSAQAPVFHFLRLCVDFAKIVELQSTPANQPCYSLYILNEIAEKLKPDYLDNDNSFHYITEDLIKHLEEQLRNETAKRELLQKFIALFYGRCLDTNIDTSAALPIVQQVLSLDRAELVLVMSPVILRLLIAEQFESPTIFIDIITKECEFEDHFCLQTIDEVFKDLFTKELIHHDSYAAVMICDLIQSLLNFDFHYDIQDLDSSDCELLCRVRRAIEVLCGDEQTTCGLVLLSSVAFLRAFFTMLSNAIAPNPNVLLTETSLSRVMSEISSLLAVDSESPCRRSSLRMFFLKKLHQDGMRLFDIQKLCEEGKPLASIKHVFMESESIPKADLCSVRELPENQQAKSAYLKLTKGDEKEMLRFLDQCQESANHRFSLMRILGNRIYVKRAEQKLTDKEERLTEWLSEKIKLFKMPMKEVLLRIIGQKDFHHHHVQLSPESSVKEVEIGLLILHISFVLTSAVQRECSPLKQYFSDPWKCKQSYILAHGENRIYQAFETRASANHPTPITCPCGLRVTIKDDQVDNKCPRCRAGLPSDDLDNDECFVDSKPSPTQGYSTTAMEASKWDARTKEMSPSVFRALHLIVHVSFYAGVAMGISSKDHLSSLLGLTKPEDSPEEFCYDHITADLKYLTTILCCKEENAIKVMHVVIEKCTKLFRGEAQASNTCSTHEQRLEWEIEFSDAVKDVLPQAFGSTKALKITMKEGKTSTTTAEDQLQEIDTYPETLTQQAVQLKRLFRMTKQPSFDGFHSMFVNTSTEFQESHGFLSLFFAKFQELSMIGYLHDLLKWTRLVSSALTHRISRKDAESKTINDFITGHLLDKTRDEDERKSHQDLFNRFKEAWNKVRYLVKNDLHRHQKGAKEMPRLTDMDPIGYCLVESDSGFNLRCAIKILVTLQNSILDEIIYLSAQQQHDALRFLEKNKNSSGTSCVSIQEANENEIINFHWSDEFLTKYGKTNPEYGQGEETIYDFERMEIELANDVAFGKCYLVGSLNKFVFSNELFHSVGPMLTEIRKLLFKTPSLPDEVRQGLSTVKERRIQDAQNLLQHIEVLIFLIKQRGVTIDGDMALEKFVEMMTTRPFPLSLLPEPKSSIKLEHIPALYEALEDLLADGAIEGVPEQFRQHLTDEMKEELEKIVSGKRGQILRTILNALRRFVFRYLSSEKFLPKETISLSSWLKEPSLWTPVTAPDELKTIPGEITLEHIHSVIIHLQDLEEQQRHPKRLGLSKPSSTTTSKKRGPQKKKRIMANFSRA